jgi:predicted enzyme related to lactoylglutathione lyase
MKSPWEFSRQEISHICPINHTHSTPSALPSISEISADILADHPGRQWISLEQMVRRIDGLHAGIGLDNTDALIGRDLSSTIYTKESPVYQILESRWYDLSWWVDSICRKLSAPEIESIAQEYQDGLMPNITEGSVSPMGLEESSSPSTQESPYREQPSAQSAQTLESYISNPLLFGSLGIGLAGGILLYHRSRKIWQMRAPASSPQTPWSGSKKDSTTLINPVFQDTIPTSINPSGTYEVGSESTAYWTNWAHDNSRVLDEKWTQMVSEPLPSNNFILTGELTQVMARTEDHYSSIFWWALCKEEIIHTPSSLTTVHIWETLGGSFTAYTKYSSEWVQITLIWYDHGAARKHVQSSVRSPDSLLSKENRETTLSSTLNYLYLEMLLAREWIKQEDLLSVQTIKIRRAHLADIYAHLDASEIRSKWLEVLGYWVASTYEIDAASLLLRVLTLPQIEELDLTPVSCTFQTQAANRKYNFAGPNGFIHTFFPPKESEFLLKYRQQKQEETGGIEFSGAAMTYNWHKHPGNLIYPSGGDISEAVHDIESQYPGRKSYLYTIAVESPSKSHPKTRWLPEALKLNKEAFGGVGSYELRSYIVEYPNASSRPRVRKLNIILSP